MDLQELWSDKELLSNVVQTVVLIVLVIVGQSVLLRYVRRATWLGDGARLAWITRVRMAAGLLLVTGLVLVWASELQTLAVSAVAVAAAIVLATKELIMCFSGGIVRQVSDSFNVGDRIEIQHVRGDVVRIGLFTLTVLEIGPGQQRTGRAVVVPNSLLLSQSVVNESFTEAYVLHVTAVPHVREDRWKAAEAELLTAARAACADHLDAARAHMESIASEHGLSAPTVEPRVFVQVTGEDERTLLVRFPTPAGEKARLEQQILRAYSGNGPEPDPAAAAAPTSPAPDDQSPPVRPADG